MPGNNRLKDVCHPLELRGTAKFIMEKRLITLAKSKTTQVCRNVPTLFRYSSIICTFPFGNQALTGINMICVDDV